MATESQSAPRPGAWRAADGRPYASRADIAPLGPRGPNPLQLHTAELDVLRSLQASGLAAEADDPVWDELEALGFVALDAPAVTLGVTAIRYGMLTSLGRRYRTG
jgi:hypothetical protein